MKKFTRLWQLMMIVLLSSSVVFAQEQLVKQKAVPEAKASVSATFQKSAQLQKVEALQKEAAVVKQEKMAANEAIKEVMVAKKKQASSTATEADPNAKPGNGNPCGEFLFDMQFNWPLSNPVHLSSAIETDGNYIYVSYWQYDTMYRFNMDGTYNSWFIIPGVANIRDFAWDGTYFYGAEATTTVWQMDFTPGSEALVSTITAPTAIRGIGSYDDGSDAVLLFGNNWSTDVNVFTLAGTLQGSFAVGPTGQSYYGFAYDNMTTGNPYIWGYAQIGTDQNQLVQMDYDPVAYSAVETGVVHDIGCYLGDPGIAGGLAIAPAGTFVSGEATILGTSQNESIWGIELDDPNPCPIPADVQFSNKTQTSIDISWTSSASAWEIEYGPAGFTQGTGTTVAVGSNPYTLGGLSAATPYDVYLRADCGSGSYSGWTCVYTFATDGDCSWECVGYDSFGDGWNGGSINFVLNGSSVGTWIGPATTGPESYFFPVTDGGTLDLVWTAGTYDSEITYEIYDPDGVLVFSDGPNPTGTTGIAAYCPACSPPNNLTTTMITANTARFNWDDANMVGLYDVCWGEVGTFDPNNAATYTGSVFGKSFPLGPPYLHNVSGLNAATSYAWSVRTDCGTDAVSAWATPATFATSCGTIAAPWSEGFESGVFPNCWTQETTDDFDWTVDSGGTTSSGTGPSSGANGSTWYIYTESSSPVAAGDVAIMYTPNIDLTPLADPELSFYYHMYGLGMTPNGTIDVGISTDGGTTYNSIWSQSGDHGDVWLNAVLDLSAYSGMTVSFSFTGIVNDDFTGGGFSFENDFALDDIEVRQMVVCPAPTGLSATNVTTTSADLNWTSSSGVSNIEYGPSGFTLGTGTQILGQTSPYTLGGLTDGTDYDFYVQDDCTGSGNGTSTWAGPEMFSTPCIITCPTGGVAENEPCGDDTNGGCNAASPVFEPVPASGIVCGTTWALGGTRDTDWFELTLTSPATVTMTVECQQEAAIGLIEQLTPGCPGCDNITGSIAPYAVVPPCTVGNVVTAGLPAGTYYFFVGLSVYDGFPCDVDYVATWSTSPYSPAPGEFCSNAITAVEGINNAPAQPMWYSFAGNDQLVTVTSCITGQSVDTYLTVLDDCCGNIVAQNDDDPDCVSYGFSTTLEFFAAAGTTYYLFWEDVYGTAPFDFEIISGLPNADIADLGGYDATLVEGGTASANLTVGNSGNYPLNYTADVTYPGGSSTVNVYPMSTNYWTGTTDGTTYTQPSQVQGYGATSDGYMIFDVSSIPDGATITNVVFNGYVYETYYPFWSVTPCYMDPLSTSAADLRTHINTFGTSSVDYAYNNESSTFAPGAKTYNLINTVNADLEAALPSDQFAVGILERDGTDSYYLSFDGWNETNPPYLEVTYTTVPTGWITIDGGSSTSGTVLEGDPANMHALAFDATGVPVGGPYSAAIEITTNEPVKTSYSIPVTLTVVAGPGATVSGTLNYPKAVPVPLDNVDVMLMDGNINMGTATTDVAGMFSFSGVPDIGTINYTYEAMTTKAITGAFNIGDAFYCRNSLAPGGPVLNSFQMIAADIAPPPGVNIGDAFAMRQYLAPPPGSANWPSGPVWLFISPTFTVSGATTQDFNGLVTGDVLLDFAVPPGN